MNARNRNLPRLNDLFLQRRKYDAHLHKMDEIKHSKKHYTHQLTPCEKSTDICALSPMVSHKKLASSKRVIERNEEKLENINVSLHEKTPFDKKREYEIIKENRRLQRKLKHP